MEIKKFTLQEICDYLSGETEQSAKKEKFKPKGLCCPLSTGRGMGGFSRMALLVPQSIHIIVSPPSCGRHGDFDMLAYGIKGRFFRIRLEEKEIVSGTAAAMVKKEVLQLISSMEEKPKAVTLCITCVDALINTDYMELKKALKNEFGIRFGIVRMFPFLADSIRKHTEMLFDSVYNLIETDVTKEKRKAVNIIGKITEPKETTDFYQVLKEAGYEVCEIQKCKTIEEFDRLGESCLNVVVNEKAIPAANMMKRKYKIPYIEFMECLNPEEIAENYRRLEKALDCKLDTEAYYRKAIEKAEELKTLLNQKTSASGGTIDYNPVKTAYDLARIGVKLQYFVTDGFRKTDEPYYRWLSENSGDTQVYLIVESEMMNFIDEPEEVDYAVGMSSIMFMKSPNVKVLSLEEEPYDFVTFTEAVDVMTENMKPKTKAAKEKEPSLFARKWSVYEEKK